MKHVVYVVGNSVHHLVLTLQHIRPALKRDTKVLPMTCHHNYPYSSTQ